MMTSYHSSESPGFERIVVFLAAIAGLLGVIASAGATHATGGGSLQVSANFLLFHAAVLFGLAALGGTGIVHRGAARAACVVILVGMTLFCGDLALRALAGIRIAAFVAPVGGLLLMLGWVIAAFSAIRRP
ncbi:MAG TPA: DUF423 domain-containing protein [Saliniramus sp.]|nr:DUF423 domain-containing protein [Saliniramus sp.]